MNPELTKALLAVQKQAPGLRRDGTNPHFRNSYVTLETLMEAVRPVLNEHGLVLMQSPSDGVLLTYLIHAETGEHYMARTPLMLTKEDPQSQGSAITYARRYALMSLLALVADDDDDGNAARPAAREHRDAPGKPDQLDPSRRLIEGAVDVKGEEDVTSLQQAQRDLAPNEDWVRIENELSTVVFGKILPELSQAEWGQWWRRLANAVAKAWEGGDFPPPSREEIQQAYAWAFNGHVLALDSLAGPFTETEETKPEDATA